MNVDPLELLAQQQQAVQTELVNRLYKRADPMAQAVLEALEIWVQLADNPSAPAQAAARDQITRYVKVFDRMRAIAAGLVVAPTLPGGGNGRGDRTDRP